MTWGEIGYGVFFYNGDRGCQDIIVILCVDLEGEVVPPEVSGDVEV